MAMQFQTIAVVTVVGDGNSTSIAVDVRDLADLPNFKSGTRPDRVIAIQDSITTGVLSGHILTLSFSSVIPNGEARSLGIVFGIDGH